MQMIGKKRIDGTAGRYLSVQGNGGVQPLGIQEGLVPGGLRDVTVKMPLDAWAPVQLHAPQDPVSASAVMRAKVLANEPSNGRIPQALKNGPVPGCTLQERGVRLVVR